MGKRKKRADPVSEVGQGWLMSYADMMSLIAAFFMLMMAFANFDPVGFTKKTEVMAKHFNKDKYKSSDTKMNQMQEEIAIHPELTKFTKTSINDYSLIITFSGTVLFPGQTTDITPEMEKNIDDLIKIIKTKNHNYRIIVEGHTDNQPILEDGPFKSLWEVSALRSAKVAGRFEVFGFDPKNIISVGMADSKPLAPNEDEKGDPIENNLRLNRRVVIKVLEPARDVKNMKLGLGAYFENDNK